MTDIIATVSANPVSVLIDEKTYSQFYKSMQDEIAGFKPDVSTATSRAEIAKMAYKVTRSKTAIDAAGKLLNESAREQINKVDAARRKIKAELEALAEKVRQPLTEWEDAEKAKLAEMTRVAAMIGELSLQSVDFTSAEYQKRLDNLNDIVWDQGLLGEFIGELHAARNHAIETVSTALAAAVKSEADAAELARLRAAAEEREAAETAKREAEQAEAKRLAEYKASVTETARLAELAKKQAAEREAEIAAKAKQDAELAAAEAADKLQKEHAAELAKVAADKQRLEDAERDRLAEVSRVQFAETARIADRAHRGKILREAKDAIMMQDADEETAKKIVLAIVAGEIPNVRIQF